MGLCLSPAAPGATLLFTRPQSMIRPGLEEPGEPTAMKRAAAAGGPSTHQGSSSLATRRGPSGQCHYPASCRPRGPTLRPAPCRPKFTCTPGSNFTRRRKTEAHFQLWSGKTPLGWFSTKCNTVTL
jgi:hypothetical protein